MLTGTLVKPASVRSPSTAMYSMKLLAGPAAFAIVLAVPLDAISVSLLQQFTGRQLGFFEWMIVGVSSGLLTWRDTEQQAPWGTMFLVGGAVAMTDALAKFGFVELMGGMVKGLGIGPTLLPYVAATVVALATNFISGTALYCSIFIPAAAQIGFNPASMAILIGNVAVGLIVPWAGATAATAFAAGEVDMQRMITIGLVASVIFILIVATIHVLMAGLV